MKIRGMVIWFELCRARINKVILYVRLGNCDSDLIRDLTWVTFI